MPSLSSVRRTGRRDCSTRRMISSFSEAGYLIPRLPHPRSCFFSAAAVPAPARRRPPSELEPHAEGHFAARGRTGRIARQPPFAGFQELLRPAVIQPLGDTFPSAQLGNAALAAKAVQNNPDLLLSRVVLAGRSTDLFHDPL